VQNGKENGQSLLKNMLENKLIDINVVSMHQEILDRFWETYLPSVEKYSNLRTIVFHQNLELPESDKIIGIPMQIKGTNWNVVFNKGIEMAKERGADIVGQLNDDLDFTIHWLDDCLPYMEEYPIISPGYIQQSKDLEFLKRAEEKTKGRDWVKRFFYGACMLMDVKRIDVSMFDENYLWGCCDFDLILELRKEAIKSGTLAKVSVLHHGGMSHDKEIKRWNMAHKQDRKYFDTKWKVRRAYRHLVNEYLTSHNYFRQVENECRKP